MYYILCTHCSSRLDVDDDYTGEKVECYKCGNKFIVETIYPAETPSKKTDTTSIEDSTFIEDNVIPLRGPQKPPAQKKKPPYTPTTQRQKSTKPPRTRSVASRHSPKNVSAYKKKSSGSNIGGIVIILIIIAISVGAYFFFSNSGQKRHKKFTLTTISDDTPLDFNSQNTQEKTNLTTEKQPSIEKVSFPSQWPIYKIAVYPDDVISKMDRKRLLGTNIAAWYTRNFKTSSPDKLIDQWQPGMIRMPGGSWSDALYWNGNSATKFNSKTGMWEIDYSKYSTGFLINGKGAKATREKRQKIDIIPLHEFINRHRNYTEAMVAVNAGTGNAKMAAEWVRWANKKKNYRIKYWQVGNELDGGWESGHYLWNTNGEEMTGKMYAEKFSRYVNAMKKIDSSIKVGAQIAPEWVKAILTSCPDKVDFIDHHYYFRDRQRINDGLRGMFMDLDRMEGDIKRDRELLAKYAPDRQVELGVTEWNVASHNGPVTVNMASGMIGCYAVARMMKAKVNFATQWDLFTCDRNTGKGHALAIYNKNECIFKPQTWAFYLWSHKMSDTMVKTTLSGGNTLFAFTTLEKNRCMYIMLINISRQESAVADINLGKFNSSHFLKESLLSDGSCFWYPHDLKLLWSHSPAVSYQKIASTSLKTLIPPYSVKILEVPAKGSTLASKIKTEAESWTPKKINSLEIMLPEDSPPVSSLRGYIVIKDKSNKVLSPVPIHKLAMISISGPATLKRKEISIDSGVGVFDLTPTPGKHGSLMIKAELNGLSITKTIKIRAAAYQDIPLLNFEVNNQLSHLNAKYAKATMAINPNIRPNQNVLAIGLKNTILPKKYNYLMNLSFKHLRISHKVAGVFFDVRLSENCPKDSLKMRASMQGVNLGEFIVHKCPSGKFEHIRLLITDLDKQKKMMNPTSCMLLLQKAEKLKGNIFIDDFGIIKYD